MENLIKNYENEILMAKDAVNRFKENPIAFQVAQARLSTYERVLSDLKKNQFDKNKIEMKLICPKCKTFLKFGDGHFYDPQDCINPHEYCPTCKFVVYYEEVKS